MMTTEGEVLALEGMSRAVNAADPRWVPMARWVLEQYIAHGQPFTADDVWGFLTDLNVHTSEPRALGAIIKCAAQDGRIRRVGYVQSSRKQRHAAPIAQWVKA